MAQVCIARVRIFSFGLNHRVRFSGLALFEPYAVRSFSLSHNTYCGT